MEDFRRDIAELFAEEHERNYGFRAPPEEPVELIGLSVIARGLPDRPRLPAPFRPLPARFPPAAGPGFRTPAGSTRR